MQFGHLHPQTGPGPQGCCDRLQLSPPRAPLRRFPGRVPVAHCCPCPGSWPQSPGAQQVVPTAGCSDRGPFWGAPRAPGVALERPDFPPGSRPSNCGAARKLRDRPREKGQLCPLRRRSGEAPLLTWAVVSADPVLLGSTAPTGLPARCHEVPRCHEAARCRGARSLFSVQIRQKSTRPGTSRTG